MPAISIIVPVYNAEKYIHKCIDSILSQTFADFELLLIDDGSRDNSGKICDEYANKDFRIKVFHKENGGVSSARQYGTEKANGEYIIHADSDDWVESNMLEDLYNCATKENADMIICDYYIDYKDNTFIIKQKPSELNHKNVLKELFINLHGSCCNKLIRSTFYKNFDIRFPENMWLCEDLYVIASILKHNPKISYVPHAYYHYVQDNNLYSLTKNINSSYAYDEFLLSTFSDLMSNENCLKQCRQKFSFQVVANAYSRKEFSSKLFKAKCRKYIESILTQKDISIYYKFKLIMSCLGFYKCMLKLDELKSRI